MPCKGCWGELYAHWTYSYGIDNGGKTFYCYGWFDGGSAPDVLPAPHFVWKEASAEKAQAIPVEWQWKESKNDVDCYEIG